MAYKQDRRRKKQESMQAKALKVKKKHEALNKGKKTKMVPHPDLPRTFIEVVIEDE